ncbi:hypothetical protein BJ912DRAFT_974980 [Pholiota molesta]|nr:hypothetical protein BJ912DRAFT_974980 [Pholiota molesta]
MFTAYTFTALLALAAPFVARADVTPTEPAPGDVFTAGQTCHVAWNGDTSSPTMWKGMAIELMSGNNFDMIHITTIATNQDGTAAGTFDYPCPAVNPNSPIYFYQFSAPLSPNSTWTGRFTIASSTGGPTTPATNATQPDASNDPIPWGVGGLVDPSTAVAAPSFGNTPTNDTASGAPVGPPTTAVAATTPTLTKISTTPTAATNVITTTKAGNSTAANSTTTGTQGSGAAALSLSSAQFWLSAIALGLAASVW